MAHSYRKPRPLDRSETHVRDTNLIIIATEGEKTEPRYFTMNGFKENKKVQVQVIPAIDGMSSPLDVLGRLHEHAIEYQFGEGDQFWLVIDKDRWPDEHLYELIQLCRDQNYQIALSNPCFELWLLLHFRKVDELELEANTSCGDTKEFLKAQLEHADGGNYDATYFEWIPHGLEEAPKLDQHPNAPFPDCPGTKIHQLVEQLIS
ncbi:MAG: RloB family protein [Balneolaceae bacterium]